MSDLSGQTVTSGHDLLIQDHSSAYSGTKSNHHKVIIAFSASLPHLAKGSYIGIISALYRNAIQQGTELLLGIYIFPSQIYADLYASVRHHRPRHSQSGSCNIRFQIQPHG